MITQRQKYYNELDKLLANSLEEARPHISAKEYNDILEYIQYGEYGVGWELLWHIVVEKKLEVSDDLILCGQKMGFNARSK